VFAEVPLSWDLENLGITVEIASLTVDNSAWEEIMGKEADGVF